MDSLVGNLQGCPRAPLLNLRLRLRYPLLVPVRSRVVSLVLLPVRSRVVSLRVPPLRPLANLQRSLRVNPRDSLRVRLHRLLAPLQACRVDNPRGLLPI